MNQVLQLPFEPCLLSPWLFPPGCWEGRCSGRTRSHGMLWWERDAPYHNKLQAPYALHFMCEWWWWGAAQHPEREPLLCVHVHFQRPAHHLHQTKVISIHPQGNSKPVQWFTTAPSACCCHEGRGGRLPFPLLLDPLFSLSRPWRLLPSADNEADFFAALVLCCSGEVKWPHRAVWGASQPAEATQEGRGWEGKRHAGEEGTGPQVLPGTGSSIPQDPSSHRLLPSPGASMAANALAVCNGLRN